MKELKRFGKYLILDHFVDGGMAKICRARYLGEQADKLVAIKMVQPQYSKDESFKKMFMDEIKVTFGMIHPNIVQTYDYGVQDDQLYVAMEYCDGKNLKEYLNALKKKKVVFPPEISVYITTQACKGLHYAHTLTDKLTGKKANIVHRDISPHNIMLTYDGDVKIIDFGIAKADSNSESTKAGTIKGKLSYIAPEYLEGADLDPRYDQFAIGVTLWEMLCARKLFKAANDLAVLKKIQECKVPAPSSINPNVPKELDEIILKALAKDRNERYENLDELNRALNKFLYSHYPEFNSSDLGSFAKSLFKEDIEKDFANMVEFGKIDISPYIEDYRESKTLAGKLPGEKKEKLTDTSIKSPGFRENVLDLGFDEDGKHKFESEETKIKLNIAKRKKSRAHMGEKEKSKKEEEEKTGVSFLQEDAVKEYEKKKSRPLVRAMMWALIVGGGLFYLKQIEPEIRSYATKFGLLRTQRVPSSVEKEVIDDIPSRMGTISFTNYDSKKHYRVYINGKQVKLTGARQVDVPFAENIIIRVLIRGHEHFVSALSLSESFPEGEVFIPSTPRAAYAYIYTKACEIKGTLSFNLFGEDRVEALPLRRNLALALNMVDGEVTPKKYKLIYQSDDTSKPSREIHVNLEKEANALDLCEQL